MVDKYFPDQIFEILFVLEAVAVFFMKIKSPFKNSRSFIKRMGKIPPS